MSEEFDEIVDNLREPNSWLRVLFMIAFAVVLYVIIAPVILVAMIVQALFSLITGEPNSNLKDVSGAGSQWIYQILKFILYGSEEKPFPFADFPSVGEDDEDGGSGQDGSDKTATKKAAEKKTPTKRKAKKKSAPKKTKPDNSTNGTGGDKDT